MTVTQSGKIKVPTAAFREALIAVYPHRNLVKTGDASAQHRIRLTLAAKWLYVAASNSTTTGLARVPILEDSRTILNRLDSDDGPIDVDLQPRQALELTRMFASRAKAADINQELHVTFDLGVADSEDNEPWCRFTDVGGLLTDGESWEMPLPEPHESFPDVIGITAQALTAVGETTQAKQMAADGKTLALFRKASETFKAPVFVEGSGSTDSRTFLVSVGPAFLGTLSSRHNDDDSLGKRGRVRLEWIEQLGARKLKSA